MIVPAGEPIVRWTLLFVLSLHVIGSLPAGTPARSDTRGGLLATVTAGGELARGSPDASVRAAPQDEIRRSRSAPVRVASATTTQAGDWVGTVTTEGGVTTVVNESGSVWGGVARLVEEATIGVESGADEDMLGQVSAVTADDDRIIIADRQARVVRVYDHDGEFLYDVGRRGQGPGEFEAPEAVAVGETGEIWVLGREHRVHAYSPDGTPAGTFRVPGVACCLWPIRPAGDGGVWVPVDEIDRAAGLRRFGARRFDRDGTARETVWAPEIELESVMPVVDDIGVRVPPPVVPSIQWGPVPGGGVWAGATDRYRFEVHASDGSVLVVEKPWEPVAYPPEEMEWWRRMVVARARLRQPGWNWDGSGMPTHKPAFARVIPDVAGGYWVVRQGASLRRPDCLEDPLAAAATGQGPAVSVRPCWRWEWVLEAFDGDGRYMGTVETPDLIATSPLGLHVDGDLVVTAAVDDAGIVRVRRYRLVHPGESP